MQDRDFEVLGNLAAAVDNYLRVLGDRWVRPLDCGGSNGSDHSYRLNKLAKMGLAETKPRGGWVRGSKQYTITDAGRAALAKAEGRANG